MIAALIVLITLAPHEQRLLDETNEARARHGLRALSADGTLTGQARSHASWMARNSRLQHARTGYRAENIAAGQRSAKSAVQSWLNSSGHRRNLLNPSFTRIGVAGYKNRNTKKVYWCQQFR